MKKNVLTLVLLFLCLGTRAQLGYRNSMGFVELTPDESILYRYVQAWDDESQDALNAVYSVMNETGEKTILKRDGGGWYVKKDYPLPAGNYYESVFYSNNLKAHSNELFVIIPRFSVYVNNLGRIEDLLGLLGDKVTISGDLWSDSSGTCGFLTCRANTSEEVLKTAMQVNDLGFEGLAYFLPQKYWIDRSLNSYLVSVLTGNAKDTNENGDRLVYEKDWEGVPYPIFWDGEWPSPWETTDAGLAVTTYSLEEEAWFLNTGVTCEDRISFELGHKYVVRLTLKVPSDGSYDLRLGSMWPDDEAWFSCLIPVTASDEFQVIEVECPEFPGKGSGVIALGTGWVLGTTVLNKVEVVEVSSGARQNTTAIDSVKAADADGPVYNLAGQRVDASYKGTVIQNGMKRIVR